MSGGRGREGGVPAYAFRDLKKNYRKRGEKWNTGEETERMREERNRYGSRTR